MSYDNTTDTMDAMEKAGIPATEPVFYDYFGFSDEERHYLPGAHGHQSEYYLVLRRMNEGAKAAFQKKTSRDLRVERTTGNAVLKMDPGAERHELIKSSVVGWNLKRRSPNPKANGAIEDAPFDASNLNRFLEGSDPRIIEDVEKAIRKLNPWLMDEMSVEDIDREISNLKEMREVAVEREAGKSDSAN